MFESRAVWRRDLHWGEALACAKTPYVNPYHIPAIISTIPDYFIKSMPSVGTYTTNGTLVLP